MHPSARAAVSDRYHRRGWLETGICATAMRGALSAARVSILCNQLLSRKVVLQ